MAIYSIVLRINQKNKLKKKSQSEMNVTKDFHNEKIEKLKNINFLYKMKIGLKKKKRDM